jgi:hypothetical protein
MPFSTTQVTGEYATYTLAKGVMSISMNDKHKDSEGIPKLDVMESVHFAQEILDARSLLYQGEIGKYAVLRQD